MVYKEKHTNSDRSYWRGTEYNLYDDIYNLKVLRGRVLCVKYMNRKEKKKRERESEQERDTLECFAADETI